MDGNGGGGSSNAPGGGGASGASGDGGSGAPGSAGDQGPWYAKAGVDQSHHEWLQQKQYGDFNTTIASHRALEGLIGRERLAVPKDADDKDAYDKIFQTLGRPSKPEEYKLREGSKISGDEWKQFAPIFHEAGISQRQAERILEAYEKRATDLNTAQETERANEEKRQIEALDKEWGSAAEANKDLAARAFRTLGIDEATSDKIEAAIGYLATMKLFHAIGAGMGEGRFLQDGNKPGGVGSSLSALQAKVQEKLRDTEFQKRYTHSDPRVRKSAIDEMEALQKQIADMSQGSK